MSFTDLSRFADYTEYNQKEYAEAIDIQIGTRNYVSTMTDFLGEGSPASFTVHTGRAIVDGNVVKLVGETTFTNIPEGNYVAVECISRAGAITNGVTIPGSITSRVVSGAIDINNRVYLPLYKNEGGTMVDLRVSFSDLTSDGFYNKNEIDNLISDLQNQINSNNTDISNLQNNISTINSDISTINSDISTINSDISTINSDISTINSDISTINSDISVINSRFTDSVGMTTLFNGTAGIGDYIVLSESINNYKYIEISVSGGSRTTNIIGIKRSGTNILHLTGNVNNPGGSSALNEIVSIAGEFSSNGLQLRINHARWTNEDGSSASNMSITAVRAGNY